ncbi:MAG TPA: lysophospholipid acyltransferase family protein [Anaerolineales bacterium]
MSRLNARTVLSTIFGILFRLLTRVTVIGKENLPVEGGYIAASNHQGIIEVPLVYCVLDREDVTGLVAKKHQDQPIFRWVVDSLGGIWLNRDEADARAVRQATEHLKRGGVLGIAPEGTRSPTGSLIPAKTGVAYLANRAGVPIVPVAVTGTWKAIREVLLLRRPRITVRLGEPFTLPPVERRDRDADLQRNTDEIMARIAALLPPEYRGVYADHPRLRELLESRERVKQS